MSNITHSLMMLPDLLTSKPLRALRILVKRASKNHMNARLEHVSDNEHSTDNEKQYFKLFKCYWQICLFF